MNILSYQLGTIFTGEVINTFLQQNCTKSKEVARLVRHYSFGFNPKNNYVLVKQQFRTAGPKQFGFIKITERNDICA